MNINSIVSGWALDKGLCYLSVSEPSQSPETEAQLNLFSGRGEVDSVFEIVWDYLGFDPLTVWSRKVS